MKVDTSWTGKVDISFQLAGSEWCQQWAPSAKCRNKKIKTYNGNIKSCFSIMHWNLGSRLWDKKRDEVQLLVDEQAPDYLFISEANLLNDKPDHLTNIEGYSHDKSQNH